MSKSKLEQKFLEAWELFGFEGGEPVREYRFHPTRKWRLDFAWPKFKVGVELDGYGPAHYSRYGRHLDLEKQNAAVLWGWSILRYTSTDLRTAFSQEEVVNQVKKLIMLKNSGENGG